ncbi:hypothetical protein BU26DRAFT_161635 [Trematosphaeria pertusa]|uniref:Uncharacterized protein n=1 Tax=Trematosphaeria pertusa TaxID=390896 RepID=A0A6A6HYN9_9PLEO|nr:uncharacterized protein BU26DRAFT_161635 [Trematosphaeria pertusa]KAF2242470.1 hypothetical protein BU26DRAFT_161635 [Trematosphaeria pertusa]
MPTWVVLVGAWERGSEGARARNGFCIFTAQTRTALASPHGDEAAANINAAALRPNTQHLGRGLRPCERATVQLGAILDPLRFAFSCDCCVGAAAIVLRHYPA